MMKVYLSIIYCVYAKKNLIHFPHLRSSPDHPHPSRLRISGFSITPLSPRRVFRIHVRNTTIRNREFIVYVHRCRCAGRLSSGFPAHTGVVEPY